MRYEKAAAEPMPEGVVLDGIRTESIAALSSYIEGLPGARELLFSRVKAYTERDFIVGWCVPIAFEDRVRDFHVLVSPGFPFLPPRIALVDKPDFLAWPHVEKDGVLCLLPNNSSISSLAPVSVFQNLLSRAVSLVTDCLAGINAVDFEAEFKTYWHYEIDKFSSQCRSLVSLDKRNRLVSLWKGQQFDIIADDERSIQSWLAHRYPKQEPYKPTQRRAGLFWLARALRPQEYPKTAHDLQVIATAADAMATIAELVDESASDIRVILAAPTVNGPVLAGVSVPNPKGKDVMGRKTDPLTRGFRRGRVPRNELARRFLSSSARVSRFDVARIDHDWIHGRGRDKRQAILKDMSVVILGCGSIGSAVAVSLAKSGVGKLTLVDNEVLEWPNISRHSLGASSVSLNKAMALSRDLQVNYPHLEIIGKAISINEAVRAIPDFLSSCNLVISLTANWGMDQMLSGWHRGKDSRPKLIYGWTEAHASAGHAVFTGENSCIECGCGPTGVPHFSLTEWPEDQDLQEPACGAAFQPYGGVEVSSTVTLIAGLVLDSLLNGHSYPVHRFWAGSKSSLFASGGHWTPSWEAHPEFRDFGSLMVEQPWPPQVRCVNCGVIGD